MKVQLINIFLTFVVGLVLLKCDYTNSHPTTAAITHTPININFSKNYINIRNRRVLSSSSSSTDKWEPEAKRLKTTTATAEKEKCSICMEYMKNNEEEISKTKCNHCFHTECLKNVQRNCARETAQKCPNCREDIDLLIGEEELSRPYGDGDEVDAAAFQSDSDSDSSSSSSDEEEEQAIGINTLSTTLAREVLGFISSNFEERNTAFVQSFILRFRGNLIRFFTLFQAGDINQILRYDANHYRSDNQNVGGALTPRLPVAEINSAEKQFSKDIIQKLRESIISILHVNNNDSLLTQQQLTMVGNRFGR
eukprot:Pgem_evm1s6889